jgi:hypothetical protein
MFLQLAKGVPDFADRLCQQGLSPSVLGGANAGSKVEEQPFD